VAALRLRTVPSGSEPSGSEPSGSEPPPGFGRVRLGVLAIAMAVLAGIPAGWALTRAPEAMGSLPPVPHPAQQAIALNASAPDVPVIGIHSGRLADQAESSSGAPPVRIEFPSIGVHAGIVPVGVQPHSTSMQIPGDVDLVGWYRFSAVPGEPGTSVLVGHVDSATQGPGAFFRIRELGVGSIVVLRLRDGAVRRFRVAARRSYPKGDLPAQTFRRFGPPELVMVTCGGAFDFATRRYAQNVVVYATPVSR
jgi:hypothetical protein